MTRRGLAVRVALLLLACLCMGSCAITAPGVLASNGTVLTFNMNFAQSIDPNCIYLVAIRVLNPPAVPGNPLTTASQYGPSPVVGVGSLNGIWAGWPTHYVLFTGQPPNYYSVYRLPLSGDPGGSTPLNESWPGIYVADVRPNFINPISIGGGPNGTQLGFTIPLSDLSQYANGQPIKEVQFNVFSMNVQALTQADVSERVMDAIGNQSPGNINNPTFNNPITISTQYSETYTDGSTGVPEPTGDTYSVNNNYVPSVDLISPWSVTVSTQ